MWNLLCPLFFDSLPYYKKKVFMKIPSIYHFAHILLYNIFLVKKIVKIILKYKKNSFIEINRSNIKSFLKLVT
jgi:hypothetical protein